MGEGEKNIVERKLQENHVGITLRLTENNVNQFVIYVYRNFLQIRVEKQ